ncbi:hypothetical protein [Clostridium sp.]|uniref:hypothetical protein n=1 Tax=Clostridium sp. TaxID=1506 RepID=UPI001B6C3D2A|nr:hypothetical protein [Clostridium sp.]MBP3916967.1 hypothetical protein [Clostridium sp.]
MDNPLNNSMNKLVDDINSIEAENNLLNNEMEERVNKFKTKFKTLGKELESKTLINKINEDEELNSLVYKVFKILEGINYKI